MTSPIHDFGFQQVLAEHAVSRPTHIAVADGPHRLTFPQLADRVARLASALRAAGVGHEDRIVWAGQNSFRVLECLLAAERLGAIFCPVNWRQSEEELAFVLDDVEPSVVFWQAAEIGEVAQAAKARTGSSALWVQHDQADEPGYEAFLTQGPPASFHDDVAVPPPDQPLLAIYTAAFEGRPAAALLAAHSLLLQSLVFGRVQDITDESVFLNSGPMFHMATLATTISTFHHGGKNVFVPRAEPEAVCRAIDAEGCTHAFLLEPTLVGMRELNADGTYDLRSLWPDGTIPECPIPLIGPATSRWSQNAGGYGQTEVNGLATFASLGGPALGNSGRPSPIARMAILDEQGEELGPGEVGEIAVRGPLVMLGFHRRDEENRRRFASGWHRTNDLGRREADGSITFIAPKGKLIKSGQENVYPAEVERCISELDSVEECCVIGVPDPQWGQTVTAVVRRRDGAALEAAEVIEHCRRSIASYKKPRAVVFTDRPLPRSGPALDRNAIDEAFGGGGYPGLQQASPMKSASR